MLSPSSRAVLIGVVFWTQRGPYVVSSNRPRNTTDDHRCSDIVAAPGTRTVAISNARDSSFNIQGG